MKATPIQDRVVIKRIEKSKKTEAGIFITSNASEETDQGIVVAVGAGKPLKSGALAPMTVQVGDRVLIGKTGFQQITLDGENLLVIREEEIIGIVEEE